MTVLPIRQIAYFVADVRAAAARHHALFGSGPYYVADNIPLAACLYRGEPAELDHSSAYGQWGDLMIEFVQQNNPGPSAFHDMYPEGSGREGIHHVALFVDDVDASIAAYAAQGHDCALRAVTGTGLVFAMIDMVATHGHMVELYSPTPSLTGFYAMIADAAREGVGNALIRPIRFD
ncbi:VOC family protein [Sphingomonas oryzagri]|uniref:VOC family protein n=1 Tax=Sphingomonas oryzagri TaxID=3042314 RepID=A0ABT6MY49_9SPHN|nr:VOC family protein [Sphingomonas oryzagri]MDH7637443.1 VOC family protein [Sphingomonas oryzagri]